MNPLPPPGSPYDIPAAGSLGLLALGARGLDAWRQVRNGRSPQPVPPVSRPATRQSPPIQHQHGPRLAKKLLLVGWDAADWKAINPLLDAGYMPALNRLVDQGIIGNLATLDPPLSPMLWTSIATGKTADKHGVLGFIQPDPERQRLRPLLGTTRRVKAIWNILSQAGLRTHVVGWWPSHPAEPINGVCVSNFYQEAAATYGEPWPLPPGAVHPARLAARLAELRVHPGELTAAHVLPFVPRAAEIDQAQDKRLAQIARTLAHAASVQAAATWIMETEAWDFMAVYFDAIDHFGHGFMKFHPPQLEGVPDDLFARYNHVVSAGYRFHDMMLDRLLALAGPDTTVILLSDHGFHPDHLRPKGIPKEPAGPAVEHRSLGVFCMAGDGVLRDERIYGAGLLDIAPTILTLFGLPIGQDMDGKPLVEAFSPVATPHFIPSWEDVPGDDGQHPADARHDPWAEQEMMAQLAALGYVEAPGEDVQAAIEKSVRESRYYLARVYLSTGRKEQALPILEKLVAQAPERRYALRLAQCYLDLGQLADCRRVVEAIEREADGSFAALDMLQATLLLAEAQPEAALTHLRRAEQADPQRPGLHIRIGGAYLQLARWAEAEAAYLRALAIDPENARAHHGVAVACLRQGRYEEAVEAGLTAVGLIYFQPAAHFHLGEALARLGAWDEAILAYQVCVAQAPGMRRAHLRLAELLQNQAGLPDLAAEHRRLAAAFSNEPMEA
ncbi:MAG: alkaline phosphatase family protein [Anaerolineales bacterium]|nr:alkaline phosphatase family protein [Anaerolineales bacterium]